MGDDPFGLQFLVEDFASIGRKEIDRDDWVVPNLPNSRASQENELPRQRISPCL